jgi:hypothetical protein
VAPNVNVGQLTSFRDLRYDPRLGTNGRLVENPIFEYYSLRGAVLAKTDTPVPLQRPNHTMLMLPPGPSAADIELNLTLPATGTVQLGFACVTGSSSGCGYTA